MNYRNLALAACLVMSYTQANAQPFISSVDTSNLGSGVLTINGNGFGQGAHVQLFDTFDSGSPSAGSQIPLSSPDIGAWTSRTAPPVYGSQSHSGNFSAQMSNSSGWKQFQHSFGQGVKEVFVSFWVRIPNGTRFPGGSVGDFADVSSWKFTWLIDQDYQGNSSDVCLPTHTGSGSFMLAGNDYNIVGQLGNDWWSWTSWVRIAVWLRANPSSPTANGDVLFQTLSQEKGLDERWFNTPVFDSDGPSRKQYQSINVPGWMRGGSEALYDDFYIATGENAIARVELTDSANYSQSRKIAVQPSATWSGNKVTVNVNRGGFSDLNNVYVFVWDKDGNRNSTGYPVSGGGFPGSDNTAPPNYPGDIE